EANQAADLGERHFLPEVQLKDELLARVQPAQEAGDLLLLVGEDGRGVGRLAVEVFVIEGAAVGVGEERPEGAVAPGDQDVVKVVPDGQAGVAAERGADGRVEAVAGSQQADDRLLLQVFAGEAQVPGAALVGLGDVKGQLEVVRGQRGRRGRRLRSGDHDAPGQG